MRKKIKPSKLNKYIVVERTGITRGQKFSVTFNDFGFRCAYIKPSRNTLLWLIYTLRRNNSEKYFELVMEHDYDFIPDAHGGISFINFNGNQDRGFTDGLVIGWDYGHSCDSRGDFGLIKKYFGENTTFLMNGLRSFNGVHYNLNDVLKAKDMFIENMFYIDNKYKELKKELQRMIFKPFLKKRKYKNK